MLVIGYARGGTNTVYNFLRNDASARAAALAGSFVTIANDPNAIFYNPAGLSTLESPMGSLGFFKHLLDINAGYVSFGQLFEGFGHVGAGIIYTNYGSFDQTDDLGNTLGTFRASDIALTVGYATTVNDNLHLGGALKFINSSIASYSSSGLAADLGALYAIPDTRITVGASLRNLGSQLSSYATTKEDLPLDFTFGASVIPRGLPLLLNFNFHKLNEDADTFSDRFRAFTIGGEFTLSKALQVRIGYDNENRKDLKVGTSAELAGFSGGLGITIKEYTVDYSITSLGKIGSQHRVSVGARL
jgi:long-subunit fatty acid transport protein